VVEQREVHGERSHINHGWDRDQDESFGGKASQRHSTHDSLREPRREDDAQRGGTGPFDAQRAAGEERTRRETYPSPHTGPVPRREVDRDSEQSKKDEKTIKQDEARLEQQTIIEQRGDASEESNAPAGSELTQQEVDERYGQRAERRRKKPERRNGIGAQQLLSRDMQEPGERRVCEIAERRMDVEVESAGKVVPGEVLVMQLIEHDYTGREELPEMGQRR